MLYLVCWKYLFVDLVLYGRNRGVSARKRREERSDGRGRVEEKVGVEGGKRVEQVDKGGE